VSYFVSIVKTKLNKYLLEFIQISHNLVCDKDLNKKILLELQ